MLKLFVLTYSLLLFVSVTDQELAQLKQVPPRSYPYVVDIGSHEWCHGVLITTNYVLTNARCVAGSENITVFLGWYSYPQYQKPVNESDIQIYSTSTVIPHPDYKIFKKYWNYSNDIALVKLSQAVSVTSGVKPVKLAHQSSFKDKNLIGQYATVFGWWPAKHLSAAVVQIRSPEECRDIFGRNYVRDRQLCVKWPEGERLCSHHSLPMEINGTLIGLQQDDPQNDVQCSQYEYKFINILFYYDWIMENSDLEEYIRTRNDTDNNSAHDDQAQLNSSIESMEASEEIKESHVSNEYVKTKKRCKIDIESVCPNNKEGAITQSTKRKTIIF